LLEPYRYCPDGAYADDVMHQAFLEISAAAAILGNRRTRRLYDLGYIDDAGRRTKAGLAHTMRLRAAALAGGAFVLAAAAVLFLNFRGENIRGGKNAVQLSASTSGGNGAQVQEAQPMQQATGSPKPAPRPASEPQGSPVPVTGTSATEQPQTGYAPPQEKPPGGDAVQQDLKPAATQQEGQGRTRKSHTQLKRKRYAQTGERRSRPAYYEPEASGGWDTDIWSAYSGRWNNDDQLRPGTLRSAHCLACLSDGGADCSRICR
jgi:hypothetical protein